MPEFRETARIAYEAFCAAKGYRTRWDDLPETERDVWREVARMTFRHGWWEMAAPPPR